MSSEPNPFHILGLEPKFDIDPAELDRRQRELTLERRSQGPLALETLNQAVRLLKDPVSRAEHLFQLRGLPLRSVPAESLLERVFVERERIESWRRGRDTDAIQVWLRDVALPRQRELVAAMAILLDTSASIAAEQALGLLDELRYGARTIAAAHLAIDATEG